MRARILAGLLAALAPGTGWAQGPEGAEERLLMAIEQLRDSDQWKTRMEAAVVLGRSGDIRARKPLESALIDPHYAVRAAAIRALTKLHDPRGIRPLLECLGDDEPYVRMEARQALELFDLEAREPYLIHALKRHASAEVRMAAAEMLAASRSEEASRALLDASGDEGPLGRFAVSAIRALPEKKAVALFLLGLEQKDYGVQVASVHALADLQAPAAAAPIIQLLDSEVPEVTLAATQALARLSAFVDKSRISVLAKRAPSRFERARAIKVLGILGGEDAALLILNALDDPDVLVRGAAVSGVSALQELRAIPKLEEMKKSEDNGRIIALVRATLANLQRLRERQAPKTPT